MHVSSRTTHDCEHMQKWAYPRGDGPEAQAPSADCSGADLMGEAAACSTAAFRSAISSAVRLSSASSSRLYYICTRVTIKVKGEDHQDNIAPKPCLSTFHTHYQAPSNLTQPLIHVKHVMLCCAFFPVQRLHAVLGAIFNAFCLKISASKGVRRLIHSVSGAEL